MPIRVRWSTREKIIIELISLIGLLLMAGWLIFGTWAVYKWRASEEQLLEVRQENERIQEILNEKEEEEKKEAQEREELLSYCASFRGNNRQKEICRDIASVAFDIEVVSKITGFAKYHVAVSSNESLFKPSATPSYNSIGAGACKGCEPIRFKSYRECAEWHIKWLNERGFKKVDLADVKTINHKFHFASNPTWWRSILHFLEMI